MLQQRNFIRKAYGSIDGETGKDISAYFTLELNEQNFVAHPCFGIFFKRLKFVGEGIFSCFVILC